MTRKEAAKIAQEYIKCCNPELWDGNNAKPKSVDDRIYEVPLSDSTCLDISIAYDGVDGWCHFCEIVDIASNDVVEMQSGYGIDSIPNLTDTILGLAEVVKR
mgnify:CR=1 FL=1